MVRLLSQRVLLIQDMSQFGKMVTYEVNRRQNEQRFFDASRCEEDIKSDDCSTRSAAAG